MADAAVEMMSRNEVAATLGVTFRTVDEWARRGVIRRACQRGRTFFLDEDVAALQQQRRRSRRLRHAVLPARALESAVDRLRTRLAAAVAIIDMRWQPLDVSAEDLVALYHAAGRLAAGEEGAVLIPDAPAILLRLDEATLCRIARATGDRDPWRPFVALQVALQRSEGSSPALHAAGGHLAKLALGWMTARSGHRWFQRLVHRADASPNRALAQRVRRSHGGKRRFPPTSVAGMILPREVRMNDGMTKTEAAAALGVSTRSIYTYVSKGVLRPVKIGRALGVLADDVVALKKILTERDAGTGPAPFAVNATTIAAILAQVRTLQRQMATVQKILGIKSEPLKMTDAEMASLHVMAIEYTTKGWPPHAEEHLADLLQRVALKDIEQIGRATQDPYPWRGLLKLAATLSLACYRHELRDDFIAARANLDGVARIWCELHGESAKQAYLLVTGAGVPSRRLLNQRERQEAIKTPASAAEITPQSAERSA